MGLPGKRHHETQRSVGALPEGSGAWARQALYRARGYRAPAAPRARGLSCVLPEMLPTV